MATKKLTTTKKTTTTAKAKVDYLAEFDEWYKESIQAVNDKLKELQANKDHSPSTAFHYTNLILKEQVKRCKWVA